MGSSQSKEEVIISQAGNSGGQTNALQFGIKEVLEIIVVIVCMGVIVGCCYVKCRKWFEKKIRREIIKSQDLA